MRAAAESRRAPGFRVQQVAEHVYVHLQPDGGWCLNNAGVIAADGSTALVDTAATQDRARTLKESVARITRTPPRFLVNTHPHGDHTFGNSQFTDTAVVIGQEGTRAEMAEAGLHLTGLWPDVHWGHITVALPDLTFRDRMTLHVGDVRVELLHLGVAHTTNDTLVWLPDQRVLFTGDVVMSGVTPFCLTGSVAGSLAVIGELRSLGAETVVSGHGPVAGPELLDETHGYLRMVQRTAADGLAAGLTPLEAAREADLGPYGELLDAERLVPNLYRAYAEAQGAPPGVRLDVGQLFARMVEFHGRLPECAA